MRGGVFAVVVVAVVASAFSIGACAGQDRGVVASPEPHDCSRNVDARYALCRGLWSAKSISLFNTTSAPDTNPERRINVPSPDGKKILEVRGFRVRLKAGGVSHWTPLGNMHDAEVAWSPDSARLFVTWTETGVLGPWHTQVFDVTAGGLTEIPNVTRNVRADLVARMKKAPVPKWIETPQELSMWKTEIYCAEDVVGSQWLNGSNEILVVALAGPDSGCKYMSNFVAYRIDVTTGKILQAYSQNQALRAFGEENLPTVDPDHTEL
jgi:hypothetical protein